MTDELRDMARELISQIDREAIFGSEDFGLHYELAEPIILAFLLRAKEAGEREATERAARLPEQRVERTTKFQNIELMVEFFAAFAAIMCVVNFIGLVVVNQRLIELQRGKQRDYYP